MQISQFCFACEIIFHPNCRSRHCLICIPDCKWREFPPHYIVSLDTSCGQRTKWASYCPRIGHLQPFSLVWVKKCNCNYYCIFSRQRHLPPNNFFSLHFFTLCWVKSYGQNNPSFSKWPIRPSAKDDCLLIYPLIWPNLHLNDRLSLQPPSRGAINSHWIVSLKTRRPSRPILGDYQYFVLASYPLLCSLR